MVASRFSRPSSNISLVLGSDGMSTSTDIEAADAIREAARCSIRAGIPSDKAAAYIEILMEGAEPLYWGPERDAKFLASIMTRKT